MRPAGLLLVFAVAAGVRAAEPERSTSVRLGNLTLKPSGFVDLIGMSRSRGTSDSISTRFGTIPLTDSPGESLGSARHSRMMLKGDLPAGLFRFSAYLESDFMNFTPGQAPYRWRQYWGEARVGRWRILGGQAWSLLRPNRAGTDSDRNVMSTDVVDPAYHVGLLGSRVRQVRLTWAADSWQAAVAWQADGNAAAKIALEWKRTHLELGGVAGRFGRRGITGAAVRKVGSRLRLVTQQYWSQKAASFALGVVPAGASGASTLEGAEIQWNPRLEIYSYAGLVYAGRVDPSANRVVSQWTAGLNRRCTGLPIPGALLLSLQYSHLGRAVWNGRAATLDFLMYRIRYALE